MSREPDGEHRYLQNEPRNQRTQIIALVAILVAAAGLYAAFIVNSLGTVAGRKMFVLIDDAMISMHYARNLAEGNGLVWNVGEQPIEGYTNLLWTLWMSLLHLVLPERWVGGGVIATSFALLLVGIWLAFALARRLAPSSSVAPIAAALLAATSYPLAFWALRGLEVGLVSVIFTSALILACDAINDPDRKRLLGLGVVLSLGVLTRPDTVVVVITTLGVLLVFVAREHRKSVLLYSVAPVVATFALLSLFRVVYYDALLPNTYALKVENFALTTRIERGAIALLKLLTTGGLGVGLAFAVTGAIYGVSRRRPQTALVATATAGVLAYSVYVGGDAWEDLRFANRYVSSILPAMFALTGVGIAAIFERAQNTARAQFPVVLAACVVVLTLVGALVATLKLPPMDATDAGPDKPGTLFWVGIALVIIAIAAAFVARRARGAVLATTVLVLLGACLAISGRSFQTWSDSNVAKGRNDYLWANYGTALREFTDPGASIVVTAAGNLTYFIGTERSTIDALGKMDPVIAHGIPRRPDYPPGHQKWDHEHSIRDLRPDVVAQLFRHEAPNVVERHIADIESWGYKPVFDTFVREDSDKVNTDALRAWLEANPH